jgi:hypothetical protein
MNPISSPRFLGKTKYQNMGPDTPARVHAAIMQVTFMYNVFVTGNLLEEGKTWSIQTKGLREAEADTWLRQELNDVYQEEPSVAVQEPVLPTVEPTATPTLFERIKKRFS